MPITGATSNGKKPLTIIVIVSTTFTKRQGDALRTMLQAKHNSGTVNIFQYSTDDRQSTQRRQTAFSYLQRGFFSTEIYIECFKYIL
jgi:hypothetical protein